MAWAAIEDFRRNHDMEVYLAVFDKSSFRISKALLGDVESYIDQHYVDTHRATRRQLLDVEEDALWQVATPNLSAPAPSMTAPMAKPTQGLDGLMENLDEPFSDTLLKLIDKKGKTDVDVYKRVNIDCRLFPRFAPASAIRPRSQQSWPWSLPWS